MVCRPDPDRLVDLIEHNTLQGISERCGLLLSWFEESATTGEQALGQWHCRGERLGENTPVVRLCASTSRR